MKSHFLSASSLSLASAVLGCCVAWSAHAAQPVTPAAAVPALPSPAELAQRQSDRAAEREDIRSQRRVVRAELAVREQACWQKFAVEDCLRKERAHTRKQEDVLRARELLVNQQEREERANLRLGEIARKQAEPALPGRMDSVERPPLTGPAPSEVDVEQTQRSRAQQAQQRALEQQARQRAHEAQVQAREASEAQRRAEAQRDYEAKQREAAERRASKQADIDGRTGQPLAVPAPAPFSAP